MDRKLDIEIAEKVMGWKATSLHDPDMSDYVVTGVYDTGSNTRILPNFSSDIAAAWEVAEKLRNPKTAFSIATVWDHGDGGKFKWVAKVEFWGTDRFEFELADTAPEAICRVALKSRRDNSV